VTSRCRNSTWIRLQQFLCTCRQSFHHSVLRSLR
jgi:hypothetical protein